MQKCPISPKLGMQSCRGWHAPICEAQFSEQVIILLSLSSSHNLEHGRRTTKDVNRRPWSFLEHQAVMTMEFYQSSGFISVNSKVPATTSATPRRAIMRGFSMVINIIITTTQVDLLPWTSKPND
jgi:hypothetical protein